MADVCKLFQSPDGRLVLLCASHAYEVAPARADGTGIQHMRCMADKNGQLEGPWQETDSGIVNKPGYRCVADYVPWAASQADILTLHVGAMNVTAQRYLGINL
jgi:hypothetical protein